MSDSICSAIQAIDFDAPAHLESTKVICAFGLIGKKNSEQLAKNFLEQSCMAYLSFVWIIIGLEMKKYADDPESFDLQNAFDQIPVILRQNLSLHGQNWRYTLHFSLKICDFMKQCHNLPNFSSAQDKNTLINEVRHDVWQAAVNAATALLNNSDREQVQNELSDDFETCGTTIGYKLCVAKNS